MSTPVSLSVAELKDVLREEVAGCTQLGIQLNIEFATLKELERQSMTKKPVMDCFREMCDHWLTNTPKKNKTWLAVYKAIGQQGNNRLVKELKANGHGEDREVDQPLKGFMEELDEMAAEWDLLGGALGIPRNLLQRIQDSKGLERYMDAMLEVWLKTGEATWEQLQKALIEVGNRRLSEEIEVYRKKDLEKQQKESSAALKKPKLSTNKEESTAAYAESGPAVSSSAFVGSAMAIVKPIMIEGTEKNKLEIAPKAQGGWCTKVTQKEESKSSIDKYTGEGEPPSCKLKITPASYESTPPNLAMEVELEGPKPPKIMKLEQQAENVSTQAPSTTSSSTRTRAQ